MQEILKVRVVPSSEVGIDSPTNMVNLSSPKDGSGAIINQTLKDSNGTGTVKLGGSGENTPT